MKRTAIVLMILLAGTALSAAEALTNLQKTEIYYLLEEEKLARDVYTVLGEEWGLRVFENISRSEETHMTRVAGLAELYNLEYRILPPGVFADRELQQLYNQLVDRGITSSQEALKVGQAIEEMDIADLENMLANNPPGNVRTVLESLLRGSENHLSAFNRQLAG